MPGFTHRYSMTILESHLDTFGHVNHAVYLELLEQARWDLITQRGFGLKEIQRTGMGPVILEANIKYRRELHLREPIVIITRLKAVHRRIAFITQEMRSTSEEILFCSAEFSFGLFDLKERKLLLPTPEWLHAIAADELEK